MGKFSLSIILLFALASIASCWHSPDSSSSRRRFDPNGPRPTVTLRPNPHDGLFIDDRDNWFEYSDFFMNRPRIFDYSSIEREGCPADIFYLDCNLCYCHRRENRPSLAACSMMLCNTPQIANWEPGHVCPPEADFYFKCNNCTCDATGRSAECTNWPCPIPNEA